MRAGDIGFARMWRSDLPPELKHAFGLVGLSATKHCSCHAVHILSIRTALLTPLIRRKGIGPVRDWFEL
jgi:hypothetical protein